MSKGAPMTYWIMIEGLTEPEHYFLTFESAANIITGDKLNVRVSSTYDNSRWKNAKLWFFLDDCTVKDRLVAIDRSLNGDNYRTTIWLTVNWSDPSEVSLKRGDGSVLPIKSIESLNDDDQWTAIDTFLSLNK